MGERRPLRGALSPCTHVQPMIARLSQSDHMYKRFENTLQYLRALYMASVAS